jgi:hypothetical protein
MDFTQNDWNSMRANQEKAMNNMYQNTRASHSERIQRKSIILDVIDNVPADFGTTPLTVAANEFSVTLHEPLQIDRLSDIYLDSFTTFDANINTTDRGSIAFILGVNEFNIITNSNVSSNYNKIIISNSATALDTCITHKSKKFNYICSINPCTIPRITGNITLADGGAAFNTTAKARFIAEFVIISREVAV